MADIDVNKILGSLNEKQLDVAEKVIKEAQAQKIDPNLILPMVFRESSFTQNKISPAGAIGVMQLMPNTAKMMGVDPNNEDQNIRGGIKYYKSIYDRFKGDADRAYIGYNAGPDHKFFKTGNLEDAPMESLTFLEDIMVLSGRGENQSMEAKKPNAAAPAGSLDTNEQVVTPASAQELPSTTDKDQFDFDFDKFKKDQEVKKQYGFDPLADTIGAGIGAGFGGTAGAAYSTGKFAGKVGAGAQALEALAGQKPPTVNVTNNMPGGRTFGSDVAKWHEGQYSEPISRTVSNQAPSSMEDAAAKARVAEQKAAEATAKFGTQTAARPGSVIQVPVDAGGGSRAQRAAMAAAEASKPKGALPTTSTPVKTPIPLPTPEVVPPPPPSPPGALQRAGNFVKAGLNLPMVKGTLGGAGVGMGIAETAHRVNEGDTLGAVLSGVSTAGSGLSMVPGMQVPGMALALGGAGALTLADAYRNSKPEEAPKVVTGKLLKSLDQQLADFEKQKTPGLAAARQ